MNTIIRDNTMLEQGLQKFRIKKRKRGNEITEFEKLLGLPDNTL
jgi:hypothetical protein